MFSFKERKPFRLTLAGNLPKLNRKKKKEEVQEEISPYIFTISPQDLGNRPHFTTLPHSIGIINSPFFKGKVRIVLNTHGIEIHPVTKTGMTGIKNRYKNNLMTIREILWRDVVIFYLESHEEDKVLSLIEDENAKLKHDSDDRGILEKNSKLISGGYIDESHEDEYGYHICLIKLSDNISIQLQFGIVGFFALLLYESWQADAVRRADKRKKVIMPISSYNDDIFYNTLVKDVTFIDDDVAKNKNRTLLERIHILENNISKFAENINLKKLFFLQKDLLPWILRLIQDLLLPLPIHNNVLTYKISNLLSKPSQTPSSPSRTSSNLFDADTYHLDPSYNSLYPLNLKGIETIKQITEAIPVQKFLIELVGERLLIISPLLKFINAVILDSDVVENRSSILTSNEPLDLFTWNDLLTQDFSLIICKNFGWNINSLQFNSCLETFLNEGTSSDKLPTVQSNINNLSTFSSFRSSFNVAPIINHSTSNVPVQSSTSNILPITKPTYINNLTSIKDSNNSSALFGSTFAEDILNLYELLDSKLIKKEQNLLNSLTLPINSSEYNNLLFQSIVDMKKLILENQICIRYNLLKLYRTDRASVHNHLKVYLPKKGVFNAPFAVDSRIAIYFNNRKKNLSSGVSVGEFFCKTDGWEETLDSYIILISCQLDLIMEDINNKIEYKKIRYLNTMHNTSSNTSQADFYKPFKSKLNRNFASFLFFSISLIFNLITDCSDVRKYLKDFTKDFWELIITVFDALCFPKVDEASNTRKSFAKKMSLHPIQLMESTKFNIPKKDSFNDESSEDNGSSENHLDNESISYIENNPSVLFNNNGNDEFKFDVKPEWGYSRWQWRLLLRTRAILKESLILIDEERFIKDTTAKLVFNNANESYYNKTSAPSPHLSFYKSISSYDLDTISEDNPDSSRVSKPFFLKDFKKKNIYDSRSMISEDDDTFYSNPFLNLESNEDDQEFDDDLFKHSLNSSLTDN